MGNHLPSWAASELVLRAIDNTLASPKQGAAYFRRPAGSFISHLAALPADEEGPRAAGVLRELARDGQYVEVTEDVRKSGASFGACRYFRVDGVAGVEAACLLSDLSEDELDLVRARKGHHQPELVAPGVPARAVNFLHVCVGSPNPGDEPTAETAVVYFWAPGRVLPQALTVKLDR